jgi:hypothetical protein
VRAGCPKAAARRPATAAATARAHRARLAEPARQQQPGRDQAGAAGGEVARRLPVRGGVGRGQQQRRRGVRARQREAVRRRGGGVVEPQRIGPDQRPAPPHPPPVRQAAAHEPLAMRGAAEHQHLRRQQPRAGRERDADAPPEPRPVEQDRLLRKPFAAGFVFHAQVAGDLRLRAEAAVDLLGGRRRRGEARAGLERQRGRDPVAAGQPARDIDQRAGLRLAGVGIGEQPAQRRGLVQVAQPRAVRARPEHDLGAAIGALVAWRRRVVARHRAQPCTPPRRGKQARYDAATNVNSRPPRRPQRGVARGCVPICTALRQSFVAVVQ